jgi:sugar lactone lactonase YvrE
LRTVIYDHARDCVWVISRGFSSSSPTGEFVTLTRINAADRTRVGQPVALNADGYDVGLMALDARDVLWMAWGNTLRRFDPDTGATQQWTLPPYHGRARLYSADGRINAMTISPDGEIWLAAGMVSAVFGFNPKSSSWGRPIDLPFVPVEPWTALAAPSPGMITINGIALAGGAVDPNFSPRFAVIMTATRIVKTLSLLVNTYVAIGGGRIVYTDRAGGLVRYDIAEATSTVIGPAPEAFAATTNMTLDLEGNVWLPFTTQGFPGVARLNSSTGAVSQFPFPIEIHFYEPVPSPSPRNICMPHACFPIECKPVVVFRCIPTLVSLNPSVQGMAPDARGNVWMVTSASSMSKPDDNSIFAPVVELQPTT